MSVISYDYLPRPYLVDKKLTAIYLPIVTVRLSASHKMYPYTIRSLVDSGAEFNLFPADIGEKLGLKIRNGNKREHIGIGNVGILAYTHQVKIFLEGYSFKTKVDFSYDHKIPLLGRYGFFQYFKKVVFNEQALRLNLEH